MLETTNVLQFLAAHAMKAAIILAVACLAAFAMRRASAAARHLVWSAALTAVLLMPLAQWIVPSSPFRFAESVSSVAPSAALRFPPPLSPQSVPLTPAPEGRSQAFWLPLIWFTGAAFVLLRFAAGFWRIASISRSGSPFGSAIASSLRDSIAGSRSVRILSSARVSMPMTWGRVILLPQSARAWPVDRLRLVLSHELVHVQRRDWIIQSISQVVCAMHWFNPLVWIASDRLAAEREMASDDRVLALGETSSEYAEHLLGMARASAQTRLGYVEGVAMARQSHLERRIRAMLDTRLRRGTPGRVGAALAGLAVLTVLLPLASLRAPAQQSSGRLYGMVRDPSGATIPKAVVLAIHAENKKREVATTSDAGEFSLPGIAAGVYTIQVRKPGFELLIRDGITLVQGSEVQFDATLNLGRLQESVEVTARRESPQLAKPPKPVRIRVGGNVQAAKLIARANPIYPQSMRDQGIAGTVLLLTIVSKAGVPLEVTVLNTPPHPDLTAAAIDAVRQWRYEPTLLNGQPVEVITEVTVNFKLSD